MDKSAVLTQEFKQRIAYWKEHLTNPKMVEVLNAQVEQHGLEFIRIRDDEFAPALRSADPDAMIGRSFKGDTLKSDT